jgi:SNF2 family DNA or RNA helicase
MGLGKTLSVLALVCSTLDVLNKQKSELRDSMHNSTLIIAPKSSESPFEDQKAIIVQYSV